MTTAKINESLKSNFSHKCKFAIWIECDKINDNVFNWADKMKSTTSVIHEQMSPMNQFCLGKKNM